MLTTTRHTGKGRYTEYSSSQACGILDFSPLVGAVIVSGAISWIGEKPVSLTPFGTIFTLFTFTCVGGKTKPPLGVKKVSIGTRMSHILSADAQAEDVTGGIIGAERRGELVQALSCTDPANRMTCIEVGSSGHSWICKCLFQHKQYSSTETEVGHRLIW